MKIFKFIPVAAIACLAVSCQNSGSNGLSENASQTDSLMYYLGQMNGADYLHEALRDTTLKEASEKQAYINGVRAGLAALKEGNESYNKGVMLGMQMASQMMSFSEQMDVKINRASYINSLTSAVMSDTIPNTSSFQMEFRKVLQNIENAKNEKDLAASRQSLKEVAEKDGLPKIDDDLYGKTLETTDGEALKNGDEVGLQIQFVKADGQDINIPMAPKGNIGNKRSFPEPVSAAMLTLKSGEKGEFLSTAHAIMGPRARQFNLEPSDVIKFYVTPTLIPQETEENK